MGDIFLKLLNISITAGWLILAVLCIRLLFRRMPKWVNCLLWGIVAFRLMVPLSIESEFSLQPSAEPIKFSTIVEGEELPYVPSIDSNLPIVEEQVNPVLMETFAYEEADRVAPLQYILEIAGGIWLWGMILLFIFALGSLIRLHFLVREAICFKDNVFICDHVQSPFILGVITPRIYLSSALSNEEMDYVIAHEEAHLRRKDHWWKPFGYLLLCIYWFNPLCWIAYILLCKDIELACDEKVIRNMNFGDKKEYSRVLLSCAAQRHLVMVCPVAFGEVGVKERVKSILNYKKPAFWISMVSLSICVVLAICFLTNPERDDSSGMVLAEWTGDEQDTQKDLLEQVSNNSAVEDLAYYLELSVPDMKFKDMSEERKEEMLAEFDNLLDGYTILARESEDGKTSYIAGHYNGDVTESSLCDMLSMEYSASGEMEMLQVLYYKEDYEALDRILFTKGVEAVSTEGYIIKKSNIYWTEKKDFILIEPKGSSQNLYNTFRHYHNPEKGRNYIDDALSRGIALNRVSEPHLSVYMISEKYGEITENIPLTESEAAAMMTDNKQELTEGQGFAAAVNRNGESYLFTERTGVPKSVLDFVTQRCGYKFASPDSITGPIKEASLECRWLDAPIKLDASYLPRLEEILKSAEYSGVGNCGYIVKLNITLEDGDTLTISKGADDCGTFVFGSYGGYRISEEAEDEFWEMFGLGKNAQERFR